MMISYTFSFSFYNLLIQLNQFCYIVIGFYSGNYFKPTFFFMSNEIILFNLHKKPKKFSKLDSGTQCVSLARKCLQTNSGIEFFA